MMLAVYDFSGAGTVGWKTGASFLVIFAIAFIYISIFISYL